MTPYWEVPRAKIERIRQEGTSISGHPCIRISYFHIMPACKRRQAQASGSAKADTELFSRVHLDLLGPLKQVLKGTCTC